MITDQVERLKYTIDFVRQDLANSKAASVFNDMEVMLYAALGLPDNKALDFVRTSFANDATRKKAVMDYFGIDLSRVARGKVSPVFAAIIYVHGDLTAISQKFEKRQSTKRLAYINHPLWRELEGVILDSSRRVRDDWKARVRAHITQAHAEVKVLKSFLSGFLTPSDMKTEKHATLVQRIIKKIEADNSFGIDRKGS